jgi:putative Holliday junction resolvase
MANKRVFLGLDVGTKRIGVAVGDSIARIAQPVATVAVDGNEANALAVYCNDFGVTDVIVGRPRNQSGDTTNQTALVESFIAAAFKESPYPVQWQDESVTSVVAEERLKARKKPYTKADIDAEAAAIILQDYLETL